MSTFDVLLVVALAAAVAAIILAFTGRSWPVMLVSVATALVAIALLFRSELGELEVPQRPTEVASALAGLVSAIILWMSDHNTAALVAGIGGFLPALITAGVELYRKEAGDKPPPVPPPV